MEEFKWRKAERIKQKSCANLQEYNKKKKADRYSFWSKLARMLNLLEL